VILFLFNQNKGQVWAEMLIRPLGVGLLLTGVLFGVFYLLFRNRLRTGVFVSLLVMGLVQYGVMYDVIERFYYAGSWPFGNIHRYLLLLFLTFYVALFFYIKKSQRSFIRVNLFLNMLLALLLLFNLIQLLGTGNEHKQLLNHQKNATALLLKTPQQKPDIYYIILDGYGSSTTLRKYYHFDNSDFTNWLKNEGFAVADSAKSNYYYTSQSLSSTLNMDYLDKPTTSGKIKYNRLFEGLKSVGYKIYNVESGYAVTGSFEHADSTITISGPNEFEKSLLRTTILRLDDLFGFIPRMRLVSQFEKMFVVPDLHATPKFVFLHIVAPHPPYVFHANGAFLLRGVSENSWEPGTSYIEQLRFVNTQVQLLIKKITNASPNAVVVLQSDHGPWTIANSPEEVFEARSGILYALYPKSKFTVNNHATSVNTFRMVLDTLFGTNLGAMRDSLAGRSSLLSDPILLKKSNGLHK
jgi:hypothetical protein